MGICASTQCLKEGGIIITGSSTAKIVHLDGNLQELRNPVKASDILSQYPNCFLCLSESMFVDYIPPQVPRDEEIELGQIYFLMPVSQYNSPLSLHDLCSLAITASVALGHGSKSSAVSDRNGVGFGIDMVGSKSFRMRRGNRRIEL